VRERKEPTDVLVLIYVPVLLLEMEAIGRRGQNKVYRTRGEFGQNLKTVPAVRRS